MQQYGIKSPSANLEYIGLSTFKTLHWNLEPAELFEAIIDKNQGVLSDTGAIAINTGEFTGRSPKDKFIVLDAKTKDSVWWGKLNIPFEPAHFDNLQAKMINYMADKELYVKDLFACADPSYKMHVRLIAELPASAMFSHNMFINPSIEEIDALDQPEWTVICCPEFKAVAAEDHTRQHNFAVLNFTKKMILIGGTGYTGEIKKGIFTVLNFVLPHEKNVLSMHCSANVGKDGDTAVFFGLSGTGKTTLSADPNRGLIGDDEHGWSNTSVFNFEGGCYAKCINLSAESEPEIFNAVKFGAILENIKFHDKTRNVDYTDISITENTRTSYPLNHIANAIIPSVASLPKNIFFLTADAFGVIPPISKLTPGQAMYQFISGYTAKVAGTEMGITEPSPTFSACFGAAFLPLHPTAYADLLGKKMKENTVNVWLINTGWTGGPYGIGNRMKLKFTRAMITAALEGKLDDVSFTEHNVFGFKMPNSCPEVPSELLNPRNTWSSASEYDAKARDLAQKFIDNFEKFADAASEEILAAAPKVLV